MEHAAKLAQWPPGVQFPRELEGKIVFDAARRCVIWRGFMTESELHQLSQLHADPCYQRAVARLFVICNRLDTPFTRRLNLVLALLVVGCVISAVLVLISVVSANFPDKHESHRVRNIPQSIDNQLKNNPQPEG